MDWQAARAAIGDGHPHDHVLDPDAHVQQYRQSAPELAEILQLAGTEELARSYVLFDRAAITAQSRYKRWMRRTNLAALLTSVAGAAAMAWGLVPQVSAGMLAHGGQAISLIATATAALGATGLYMLRSGRLLETWMNKRAQAETLRIGYFDRIISRSFAQGGATAILALEYFRRYQLDVQKAFFFNRARQHEASANRTTMIGAIGAGLAALSSAAGIGAQGAWAALGVVTVFGAALGAFAIGREQMTQDRRNAERYDRTFAALSELTRKLDDVRPATVEGRLDAARAFAASVNEHISNEHRQWLDQAEATQSALARIETALASDPGRQPEG